MMWQMVAAALAEVFLNVQVRKRRWLRRLFWGTVGFACLLTLLVASPDR
jgi:hypothetical protein